MGLPAGDDPFILAQTLLDHPATVDLQTQLNRTVLDEAFVPHHQNISVELVITDGSFRNGQGDFLRPHHHRPLDPGEQAR